jgi:DnaK suppressor protein
MPKAKKANKAKTGVRKRAAPKRAGLKRAPAPPKKAKKPTPKKKAIRKKKDDFRNTFLESLQAKRKDLKETLERLLISRREYDGELTAGDFIDEIDDAQREISAYSLYSLIERKHRELRRIEYLIGRILKEEEFGLCEECGAQIPKERLLIVPEATLCVTCQRELEREDRRSMGSRASSSFGSRKEMSLEPSESQDDGDNLSIEYHISSIPSVEIEATDLDDDSDDDKEEAD